MDVRALQSRLATQGYAGHVDGQLGPMTYAALLAFAARRPLGPLGQALGLAMVASFPGAGVATDLQRLHWIAQACHETEGFRFLTEQGSAAYFQRYEADPALGDVRLGDGALYRGRGLFQITGRWNYAHFGALVGEPLEDNPGLAAQPGVAVRLACAFWAERGIGPHADQDDVPAVTRKINGGLAGLAERQALTDRLKILCGL